MGDPEIAAPPGLYLDDHLAGQRCRCLAACRDIVSIFRAQAARYRMRAPLYVGFTLGELNALDPAKRAQGALAMATIDLDDYATPEQLFDAASTVTTKRRQVNRAIARAQREGYYVKPFPFALHVPDIVAIHRSKQIRNGRPIAGAYYVADVDGHGGAPMAAIPLAPPECPEHHWQYWGVFRRAEGHHQGLVRTDEVLLGYITLRRQGNSAWYDKLMGHGDHFAAGIMNLLHYEMVAHFLRERPEGLRYLIYHQYFSGNDHALLHWKARALFKPRYLHYIDDRRVSLPADPPMPGFGEGLMALKATVDLPLPLSREDAAQITVAPSWLRTFHYAQVVEQSRAPALTIAMLRATPAPPLDVLRPLAPGLFPIDAVSQSDRVAVILHNDNRGLDTLLPLLDARVADVAVYHADDKERNVLAAMYPSAWSYDLLRSPEDIRNADVVVVDPPLLRGAGYIFDDLAPLVARLEGRLILSVTLFGMETLKCDDPAIFAARFGRMNGRKLTCRKMLFRHGEPEETFWLWLETAEPLTSRAHDPR
jgi:hypothetical protein